MPLGRARAVPCVIVILGRTGRVCMAAFAIFGGSRSKAQNRPLPVTCPVVVPRVPPSLSLVRLIMVSSTRMVATWCWPLRQPPGRPSQRCILCRICKQQVCPSRVVRCSGLQHQLHSWLGAGSSATAWAMALAKAAELDDALGGSSLMFRDVQGYESVRTL